jgi:exonuclease SbcC
MLSRLFKPKWTSKDAEVRRQALQSLDADQQQVFRDLANADPDAGVRKIACQRLDDLDALWARATGDDNVNVRDLALLRLKKLINASPEQPPAAASRRQFLERHPDQDLLACAALQSPLADLRRFAIAQLRHTQTLEQCVLQDVSPENRLLAAGRIEDAASLRRLNRSVKKSDKRLYRQIRELLQQIQERERAAASQQQLARNILDKLGRLGQRPHEWSQDQALLGHLRETLEQLTLETLPDDLQQELPRQLATAEQRIDQQQRTRELQVEEQPIEFADIHEETLAAPDPVREQQYQSLFEILQAQLEKDATIGEARFEQRRERVEELLQQDLSLPQKSRLRQLWKRWVERHQAQRQQADKQLHGLQDQLAAFSQHLDRGELKQATRLYRSLKSQLDHLQQVIPQPLAASGHAQRFADLLPKWRELSQWRRWSSDEQRRQLLDELQQLATAELPDEARFHRLHKLQEAWKQLDGTGAPRDEQAWQQFQELAERIYQDCQDYLKQQSRRRAEILQTREQICAEIENFLQQADWERMDWKKAQRAHRDIQSTWYRLGETGVGQNRELGKRFQKAMERLDERLEQERGHNVALKQRLIQEARKLAEQEDLDLAMREVRSLHQQWHTTVAAGRGKENRLWGQFREACDAVGARLQQQQQRQEAATAEQIGDLGALCDRLEALIQDPPADYQSTKQQLDDLDQEWTRLLSGKSLPRRDRNRLQQRCDNLREAAAALLQSQERRKRVGQLAPWRRAAALCQRLETDPTITPQEQSALQQEFAALENLPKELRARFALALQARDDRDARQRLQAQASGNSDKLHQLCLEMEILAAIDSPAEDAEARLALKVEQMPTAMLRSARDPLSQALELERRWLLLSQSPSIEALADYRERFRLACGQIYR